MTKMFALAGLCLGMAACTTPSEATTAMRIPTVAVTMPQVTPVWWAGPATVCHRGYYGNVWCRPARPTGWVPGHYSWNGFWISGHWG